jgi:hypothetical protein
MGATDFKMKSLKHVATEMALHVLAYTMNRVMAVLGVPKLLRAICGRAPEESCFPRSSAAVITQSPEKVDADRNAQPPRVTVSGVRR